MASKDPKARRRRIDRFRRVRGAKPGRYIVVDSKTGRIVGSSSSRVAATRPESYDVATPTKEEAEEHQQPRPKIPLLSSGKDPALGERFEDELYRS